MTARYVGLERPWKRVLKVGALTALATWLLTSPEFYSFFTVDALKVFKFLVASRAHADLLDWLRFGLSVGVVVLKGAVTSFALYNVSEFLEFVFPDALPHSPSPEERPMPEEHRGTEAAREYVLESVG